jgi:hypothetical protein
MAAYIRRPRGADVSAACGMLAGRDAAHVEPAHRPEPAGAQLSLGGGGTRAMAPIMRPDRAPSRR